MRRAWLALLLLAVVGSSGCKDLFSAHADRAAEAAGQELTAERLAQIMGQTKGVQLTREAADFVANVWVDYTLLSQALAQRKNLSDSATVAETMWPQIAQVKGDRWFEAVLSRRLQLSPNASDSVYNAGQLRLVQHILYTVPQGATEGERTAALQKAQATLNRARGGSNFGALALVESQDFQSARDSGFLPASARGSWVTSVDSTIWSLSPGGISGVVESPYGYHIIRRPSAAEAAPRLQAYLEGQATTQLDSLYRDSVATARGLEVTGSAIALMRGAIADPERERRSQKKLVDFRGGGFTVGDFLRWVFALPPQFVQQLRQATDDQLKEIVTLFAQNTILLQQADSAGINLTPPEWDALVQQHRAGIDTLRLALGLGYEISDSTVSASERAKLAALRLDTYFNDLVTGKTRVRPIPATLSAFLRRTGSYKINEAGLIRAVEIAAAKNTADSAASLDSLNLPAPIPPQLQDSTAAPTTPPQGGTP
jgi:hypothetical protein